ncbi:MAG TPA: hypothetical protein PLC17_00620 [Tenuifilaceae bacterium]|nr:hypothetical protein [Tenuifilaceae bacterium]HQB77518.1 hypothetical protein [Tenuifilaceae bacterium]
MKHLCFWALMLSYGFTLCAQTDTTAFRNPKNYQTAVNHYQNLQHQHPLSNYYPYQVACYLSLQGKMDSALAMLNTAIDKGALAENILTDTDFEALHGTTSWNGISNRLKQQFLDKNKGITHPDLAVELWLMGIEDQRYRTLRKNYKKEAPITADNWKQRVKRIEEIVNEHGWPKISMVGETGAETTFLVIQHSNEIKDYIPLIINAAMEGEAKKAHAAMMIDRYLCYRTWGPFQLKPVQIYGTQFTRSSKTNKKTGALEWSAMSYYPIADPINLDARRAYIGKGNFETDCKFFGVQYPGANNLNKNIKIKKRWIRKGYLLGYENVNK